MDQLQHNIMLSLFLIIILYGIGYIVYHHLEGWNIVDSIYFQTVTFTTIGYGDVVPKSDAGKLFTVAISWIGITIAFYVLYTLSTYRERVLDQKLDTVIFKFPYLFMKKKLSEKQKKYLKKHKKK